MKSYSTDLRQKIVDAYEQRRGSQRALAALFGVRGALVEKLLRRYRTTGAVAPKPHAEGHQRQWGGAAETMIQAAVRVTPDMTLADLCTRVAETQGLQVSVPTMCRALQRLGLPRKKSRSTRVSGTRPASSRRARPPRP
jgi:transposase